MCRACRAADVLPLVSLQLIAAELRVASITGRGVSSLLLTAAEVAVDLLGNKCIFLSYPRRLPPLT